MEKQNNQHMAAGFDIDHIIRSPPQAVAAEGLMTNMQTSNELSKRGGLKQKRSVYVLMSNYLRLV
jgi:hypothetical protein